MSIDYHLFENLIIRVGARTFRFDTSSHRYDITRMTAATFTTCMTEAIAKLKSGLIQENEKSFVVAVDHGQGDLVSNIKYSDPAPEIDWIVFSEINPNPES